MFMPLVPRAVLPHTSAILAAKLNMRKYLLMVTIGRTQLVQNRRRVSDAGQGPVLPCVIKPLNVKTVKNVNVVVKCCFWKRLRFLEGRVNTLMV